MEQTRLIALLEKHIDGELPGPEWQELLRTAGGPEGEASIRQALETLLERTRDGLPYDAARFDPILRQALASDIPAPIPAPRRIPLLFRRLTAAAAILLLLAAGWIFFSPSRTPPAPIAQAERFRNDIAPGHNTAILSLDGGQKILLDSAHNGAIASQGNTLISKTGNGELAYNNVKGPATGIVYNTLTTPRGGQYALKLPDGSKVWLNAASSITYPTRFTGGERKVAVTGEAYFEIAKNKDQAFIVERGALAVQVLGTAFNMNTYDDEDAAKTTLLEGSVKVIAPNNTSILRPGQQAILNRVQGRLQTIDHANTEETMAWKNGKFEFNDASMESIMRQVARWYDVDVVYDTQIGQHFIADVSRDVPVSELLKLLELTDQVHFKIEGRKITVIP
jgi:transmembrane sensor